jgi:phospholipid/cholesterol/gamma-HCH transport system permease protein
MGGWAEARAQAAAISRAPVRKDRITMADRVNELAGTIQLAVRVVICWVTPSSSWWREAVEQAWILVKRCLLPTALSAFAFGYGAPGIQGGVISSLLGQPDRLGSIFSVASLREFVPWVTGMVVAGVAGTAICADLGARKVREELDALAVMGVDSVRSLVAPRILALTLLMPALNLMGLILAALAGLVAELTFGGTTAGYLASFKAGFTAIDLAANIVKTLGFGFIVALICSFKGINASGGSEGVGRAVNRAVVAAFVAVWVFNFAFNATYQAAFPSAQDIR